MAIKITTRITRASVCASGYVIVGVYGNKDFTSSAKDLDDQTKGAIKALISNKDLKSEAGSCVLLPLVDGIKAKRVVVVQLGQRKEFDQAQFNKAVNGVAGLVSKSDPDSAVFFISDMEIEGRSLGWIARRVVEIFNIHLYKFDQLKKDSDKVRKP